MKRDGTFSNQIRLFEGVLNSLDHPFYVIDVSNFSIVLANNVARSLGGKDARTCYQLTHRRETPCDGEDHPCPLKMVKSSRAPYKVEHIHYDADGNPYFAEIRGFPLFDDDGDIRFMVEYSNDITERHKLTVELERLQSAVQFSANAVLVSDVSGEIQYVNPAFTKITGYLSEDVMGKNTRILRSGEHSEDFYKKMWRTILNGGVWKAEFINRKKDGSLYWEYQTIAPVRDHKGKIVNFVSVKEDITERKRVQMELERLSITDHLTGLLNRRGFFSKAEYLFCRASTSTRGRFSLLIFDIDIFKKVNDIYGHLAGDQVLREISRRAVDNFRPNDFLGRCGGEEFMIILPRVSARHALLLAERLRKSVMAAPVKFEGENISVTISIGIAEKRDTDAVFDDLVRRADMALYQAKNNGRNQCMVYQGE